MKKYELYEATAELEGVTALIIGLSNQLDNQHCDTLTPEGLDNALHGIVWYLKRIVKDLRDLEERTGGQ